MMTTLDECEQKARRLPLSERALLIEYLVATLDDLDEKECERLWVAEAERRYIEYRQGTITARPADDVFQDARAKLASIG
uniref:Putative addiction module component, TIGR02574 family n=1 Tax=Candidatus Kentrum sp. FM TaxID=2126340 RepID=A0A450STT4_9GAMM|nr:MAG: putative addiction module component, TIGR02574 family [Candidatus Kentron sp. FM]VFJ76067.1 MAG: putative addiction module component, TIGR02574 family [Candidatus Kentron sp. FM]VFK21445.1 MAG: putative addiction module component, TIGR02574 family [Candidatus Kentron sp. FM]